MEDLNDLAFFLAVVDHGGFSAAARQTGIEKTRLSRRVAALERRMGVRLLQRTTRVINLTDAGRRFHERCRIVVEGARAAYDSLYELRKEPSGKVRLSCPVVMAQSYLAPILPGYIAAYPKVSLFVEATDRVPNLVEEGIDLAVRALPDVGDASGLVARELGRARRILVASPSYLDRYGRPDDPDGLADRDTIATIGDVHDAVARWDLMGPAGMARRLTVSPRLASEDLRVQLEAATHGMGIALLPEPIASAGLQAGTVERVLGDWAGHEHVIHMVYPVQRGMLPSVRSMIDYLAVHMPAAIQQRSVLQPATGDGDRA